MEGERIATAVTDVSESSTLVTSGEPIFFVRNWDDIVVNGAAWERELSGFLFMWVFGRGLGGFGG